MQELINNSENKVIVFSKPGCSQCMMLKATLQSMKVDYTEIDIMSQEDGVDFIKSNYGSSLPVLLNKETGKFELGFSPTKISEIIA